MSKQIATHSQGNKLWDLHLQSDGYVCRYCVDEKPENFMYALDNHEIASFFREYGVEEVIFQKAHKYLERI